MDQNKANVISVPEKVGVKDGNTTHYIWGKPGFESPIKMENKFCAVMEKKKKSCFGTGIESGIVSENRAQVSWYDGDGKDPLSIDYNQLFFVSSIRTCVICH